jgi:hypothetical protein
VATSGAATAPEPPQREPASPAEPPPEPAAGVVPITAAATTVAVIATWYVVGVYQPTFNTPRTALHGVSHHRAAPRTPGLARKLTLVVVDGVSFERARQMPALATLRSQGAMRELRVAFPTYTAPGITAMVTGLDPRDSGVRLNGADALGVPGLDAFLLVAADEGVPVRVRSRGWATFDGLIRLRGAEVAHGKLLPLYETTGARRTEAPAPLDGEGPTREIRVVYIGDPDDAAHEHGLQSPEYAAAEARAAALVAREAAALDLGTDAIVVVSDHGNLPQGGHGGMEPGPGSAFLLAAGGFVRRGVALGPRPQRDVATTLAVIAGLPAPSSNLGRPMLDLLRVGDDERAALLAGPFVQTADLACRIAPSPPCAEREALAARLVRGDETAADEAESLLDALRQDRDAALAVAADQARTRRLSAVAVAAALFTLATAVLARRRAARAPSRTVARGPRAGARGSVVAAALPLVHLAVYAAVLGFIGYGPSFSRMAPGDVFVRDAAVAAAAGAAVVTLLGTVARASTWAPWWLLAGAALPFAALCAFTGADPETLPHPTAAILVFYGGPALLGAAVAAVTVRLAGRLRGRRPETKPRS